LILKIYRGGSWTNLYVKTEAIADGGTNLATADDIHTFVTSGSLTLTNKTIDADNNTISNIEVDNFKASAIVIESEGIGSNDNDTTIPTSAAVKDYVDTQITAEDLDFQGDSGGALSIDLDSETLTIAGGTYITTAGATNTLTVNHDATSRSDTTSTDAPSYGGTFDAVTSVTTNATGHVTAIDVSTVTIPASDNTDVDVSKANLKTRLASMDSTDTVYIGDADDDTTVVIRGTLQVDGTTTTVDSTTVTLNDHNIVLDSGNTTSAVVDGAGITIEGGTGDDAKFLYNVHADGNYFSLQLGSSFEDLHVDAIKAATIVLGGTTVSSTAAELNILDGDTSATSTTIVDADRFVMNDAGTMKQVAASDVATYINTQIAAREYAVTLTPGGTAATQGYITKATNTYTVYHALGTVDIICQVVQTASPYATIFTDVERSSTNEVKIAFSQSVTDGDYKILITKIG
jgi:hypothetical protein